MKTLTFGAGSMWQVGVGGHQAGLPTEQKSFKSLAEGAPPPSTPGTPLPNEAVSSRNPDC